MEVYISFINLTCGIASIPFHYECQIKTRGAIKKTVLLTDNLPERGFIIARYIEFLGNIFFISKFIYILHMHFISNTKKAIYFSVWIQNVCWIRTGSQLN